jgi:hypothetical protein
LKSSVTFTNHQNYLKANRKVPRPQNSSRISVWWRSDNYVEREKIPSKLIFEHTYRVTSSMVRTLGIITS